MCGAGAITVLCISWASLWWCLRAGLGDPCLRITNDKDNQHLRGEWALVVRKPSMSVKLAQSPPKTSKSLG